MGNMGSYFSSNHKNSKTNQIHHGPTYCKSEVIDPSLLCNLQNSTPVRPNNFRAFDPRSPTDDIDRTPIMFNEEYLRLADSPSFPKDHPEVMLDPRSPSTGITRTPVTLAELPIQQDKELDGLIQILNFTDLDKLSLSDIESPNSSEDEMDEQLQVPTIITNPVVKEVTMPVSSLPSLNSTPNKSISKSSRHGSDENGSLNNSCKSPSALLARPRVPFGDVNRPVLAASPRLQLQTKQKLNLRTEIIQQQHQRI